MLVTRGDHETLERPAFAWPVRFDATGHDVVADLTAPLVEAVARAGWDVDGFDVEFRDGDRDGVRVRNVAAVAGTLADGPFRVEIGWMGDRRAITCVVHGPGRAVRWSAPDVVTGLDVYVGSDWTGEGPDWVRSARTHERLDGRPRRTLAHRRREGGVLAADDDMRRPHGPRPGDRAEHDVREVGAAARGAVLAVIDALGAAAPGGAGDLDRDEAAARLSTITAHAAMPVPEGMPVLTVWARAEELRRFGDEGDGVLEPNYRLAPAGGGEAGWRPQVYASVDPGKVAGHVVHGVGDDDGALPLRVTLRDMRGVHVVDDAAFARARDAAWERMRVEDPPRGRATDRELNSWVAAVAATRVAWADYDGSFADPTVIVERRLGPDEVRVVRGRVVFDVAPDGKGNPRLTATLVGDDGSRHVLPGSGRDRPSDVRRDAFHRSARCAGLLGHWHEETPRLRAELREAVA